MRRDQAHKYLLQTLLEVENVQATSPFILFKYQDEPALEIEWSYLTSDGHEDAEEVDLQLLLSVTFQAGVASSPEKDRQVATKRNLFGGFYLEPQEDGSNRLIATSSIPLLGKTKSDVALIERTLMMLRFQAINFSDSDFWA